MITGRRCPAWLAEDLATYSRSSYSHPEFQNLLHHQLFLWLQVWGSPQGCVTCPVNETTHPKDNEQPAAL